MRTTISISDEVLAAAKLSARERGMTLGGIVEAALRREISFRISDQAAPDVPVFRAGTGPRAGIDLTSNMALFEALDENLDLDRRR